MYLLHLSIDDGLLNSLSLIQAERIALVPRIPPKMVDTFEAKRPSRNLLEKLREVFK